eukprot:TRINITY_DN94597_c0_g1_i1.p1 TRINITY_DN94597_c0_g1~~TRINITY_DN94597_c0_g1_i1.p1  ORF type:complete len:320 (-),score=64.24 TRINITY_DN94597_c0_g1_i1:45-1004(-)
MVKKTKSPNGNVVQLSIGFDRALPPVWDYYRKNGLLMIGSNETTTKMLKHISKGTALLVSFPKKQGGTGVVGLGTATSDLVKVMEKNQFVKGDAVLKKYRKFMQKVYADPANQPKKKSRPFNKAFKTHERWLKRAKTVVGHRANSTSWEVGRARWCTPDAYEKQAQPTSTMQRIAVKWQTTVDFDKGFSWLPRGDAKKLHLSPMISITPRKLSVNDLASIKAKLQGTAGAPRLVVGAKRSAAASEIREAAPAEKVKIAKTARTASDVHTLLKRLGLQKYARTFAKEEIDLQALKLLSDGDLKSLGLPLGPRRKLQAAVM